MLDARVREHDSERCWAVDMKSTPNGAAFVLPPALVDEVEAAAQEDHRAVDDVVRDFIEHGLSERRWKILAGKERQRAREAGLRMTTGP
jgi:hypothetical protein